MKGGGGRKKPPGCRCVLTRSPTHRLPYPAVPAACHMPFRPPPNAPTNAHLELSQRTPRRAGSAGRRRSRTSGRVVRRRRRWLPAGSGPRWCGTTRRWSGCGAARPRCCMLGCAAGRRKHGLSPSRNGPVHLDSPCFAAFPTNNRQMKSWRDGDWGGVLEQFTASCAVDPAAACSMLLAPCAGVSGRG